jgi:hypothetical protein
MRRARSGLPGQCAVGAALLAGATLVQAADADPANFEGPADAGNNWIELSAGGMFPSGSKAQAEQSRHMNNGGFGGIEDLHLQHDVAKGTTFSLDGRGIYDNHDYSLSLGLKKEELYFFRLHFENFRTWYNGNGGYYPYGNAWYPNPHTEDGEAFALDRGEVSFEAGWTPKDLPSLTFKYTHLYRDGEKSSTSWGYTHPGLVFPTRGLVPSFYDIDEQRDIFELDAKYRYKATDFGLGLSYEKGDLDNARKMWQYPGEPAVGGAAQDRKITEREGVSYDALNVHAFSETWIKPNLFLSAGLLYSTLDGDTTGRRVAGDNFDVNQPNAGNPAGFTDLNGGIQKHEYVGNVNLMATPVKHLTVVPSIRVQKEDWDADSTTIPTSGGASGALAASNTDGDALDVRERLDVRYSGVTNWVFFAQGEWTQGQGNRDETGGIGAGSPILRETEDDRRFQKYSLGVKWYPARRVSLEVGGYYKQNNYDYDHTLDNTTNALANLYPAYLVTHDFATYDGNVRMTLRPARNLSLVTRYEYQWSTVHTTPTGQSEVESSEMTSHIFSQNVNWTPWSRLYLQAGFNLVASETKTPASDYTQAVLDSQNNYWTLTFNSGFVLDNKTDLNLGYTYYRADNYEDNSDVGLPYGVGASEHGVTATVVRRLTPKLRLTLRYGYYTYNDETSGDHNDYDAHVVYSGLQYRF